MVNFLFALIELLSLSITVPKLTGKTCTQILPYLDRVVHSSILSTRKLETLGYPMAKTASFCVPSF